MWWTPPQTHNKFMLHIYAHVDISLWGYIYESWSRGLWTILVYIETWNVCVATCSTSRTRGIYSNHPHSKTKRLTPYVYARVHIYMCAPCIYLVSHYKLAKTFLRGSKVEEHSVYTLRNAWQQNIWRDCNLPSFFKQTSNQLVLVIEKNYLLYAFIFITASCLLYEQAVHKLWKKEKE